MSEDQATYQVEEYSLRIVQSIAPVKNTFVKAVYFDGTDFSLEDVQAWALTKDEVHGDNRVYALVALYDGRLGFADTIEGFVTIVTKHEELLELGSLAAAQGAQDEQDS